jgi:hypothetical protein
MQLRGFGDACVEVPGANFGAGQSVTLAACTDGANQKRGLSDGRTIKSNASNVCLEVPNGTASVGKLVRPATCNYGSAQQFSMRKPIQRTRCNSARVSLTT